LLAPPVSSTSKPPADGPNKGSSLICVNEMACAPTFPWRWRCRNDGAMGDPRAGGLVLTGAVPRLTAPGGPGPGSGPPATPAGRVENARVASTMRFTMIFGELD
jgi:hypothetical protein